MSFGIAVIVNYTSNWLSWFFNALFSIYQYLVKNTTYQQYNKIIFLITKIDKKRSKSLFHSIMTDVSIHALTNLHDVEHIYSIMSVVLSI